MKKAIRKVLVISAICGLCGLAGCTTVQQGWNSLVTKVESIDWVKMVDGSITAVQNLQKLAKVGIGLPCKFGLLDKDVCALYELADDAATPALANGRAAMDAYKADPSQTNTALIQQAYTDLNVAWDTYNKATGKVETANPAPSIAPVPTPAPAVAGASS